MFRGPVQAGRPVPEHGCAGGGAQTPQRWAEGEWRGGEASPLAALLPAVVGSHPFR